MNRLTKRNYIAALFNTALIIFIFLLHYTRLFDISVFRLSPMLLLPFLVSFAIFTEEMSATFTGAIIGVFCDSNTSGSSCFHTIFFFLAGFTVSLMMHYLLNNNIRSAIVLSVIVSSVYYVLRWAFFHAFTGSENSVEYLMKNAFPSILYTAVFIFPFYYLQRLIYRFKKKGR